MNPILLNGQGVRSHCTAGDLDWRSLQHWWGPLCERARWIQFNGFHFILNIPWETGSYLKRTASVTAPCRPTIGWSSSLAMRLAPASLACRDSRDANLIWNTTQTTGCLLGRVTTWMLIAQVGSCSLVAITPLHFFELLYFLLGWNLWVRIVKLGCLSTYNSTKVMHHLPAKGSGPRLPILVWHQVFQLDPNECWDLLQGSLLQHRGSAHGLCWRGQ